MQSSDEFDTFYAVSSRRVLAQVYAMIGNMAEAEDAVAEAYVRAWRRWSTVSEVDDPEAWVRRVAYRIAVSAWRRGVSRLRAHHRDAPGDHVDPVSPNHVAIVEALRRIPVDQRRVVVLFHLAGRSIAEIAVETGVPANTVKTWLARGRRAMAEHLADERHTLMVRRGDHA